MNEELSKNLLKTGTSIVGIACKDGVILAADKQTSYGNHMISDKDTLKIQQINDYLVLAEAGLVSDIQLMIKVVRAQLRLKAYEAEGWILHDRVVVDKSPQAQAIRTHSHGLMFKTLGNPRAGSQWLKEESERIAA